MWSAFALGVVIGQQGPVPRVRVTAENGGRGFVERLAGSGEVAVCLAFGAGAVADTPETHGARHLLEHLAARVPEVDQALESRGMVLLAETTRDATFFEVRGPAGELRRVLASLKALIRPIEPTREEIVAEAGTIFEESALVLPEVREAAKAWSELFGDQGLDPFGTVSALRSLEPAAVALLARQTFVGGNASLAVVGDIDPAKAAAEVREWLDALPSGSGGLPERPPAPPRVVRRDGAGGPVLARPIGPLTDSRSLANLAGAFGLAAARPRSTVTFTPSPLSATVTVSLVGARPTPDMTAGQAALASWLRGQAADFRTRARWRAVWALADRTLDLDDLPSAPLRLSQSFLDEARRAWTEGS